MTKQAPSEHVALDQVLPLEAVRISACEASVRRQVWWLRTTLASASGVFAFVLAGPVWAAVAFIVSGVFWTVLTTSVAQEVAGEPVVAGSTASTSCSTPTSPAQVSAGIAWGGGGPM
jgi:hypothetical protein